MANTTKKTTTKKQEPKQEPKKILKLSPEMMVRVVSTIFGELIFVNDKTGDYYKWEYSGDVQVLSVADLRAMKSSQRRFFEDNWVAIDGLEEDLDEEYTNYDICKALQIDKYYTDVFEPTNIDAIFKWKPAEIEEKFKDIRPTMYSNIIVRANELAVSGELDSIKVIKALEKATGLEIRVDLD